MTLSAFLGLQSVIIALSSPCESRLVTCNEHVQNFSLVSSVSGAFLIRHHFADEHREKKSYLF